MKNIEATEEEVKDPQLSLRSRLAVCRRILATAWRLRPGLLISFFIGAALEIIGSLLAIYATAKLGGQLAAFIGDKPAPAIWFWLYVDIAASAVVVVGFFIMSYTKRLLYFTFSQWAIRDFQSALCRIDLPEFYEESMRNRINKVSGSYSWQLSVLCDYTLDLIYGIARFAVITVVVAQITWWLVPLLALFLVPTLLAESRLAKLQWFVWDKKGDQRQIFFGLDYIMRLPKGQMELRSLQATGYVLGKIEGMNGEFYREQEKSFRKANGVVLPTKILEIAGTGIGAVVVLKQLLNGLLTLDQYFFLSGALLRVSGALNAVFGTLSHMQDAILFADSYFQIINVKPRIVDTPNAVQLSSKKVPALVFENVSFRYPGQKDLVFDKLNLTINPGEHVALVGENGAGKSTLIKLLLRFYVPTGGRILIDGHDLQDIAIDSWYARLATLFQDFNQYPLPVGENISIGRSLVPADDRLRDQAANFGGVDSMIARYEHGWETVLDSSFKKGIEPSGGQWQRIAIARAFYRRANVLVLDEPTSAIDAQAEYHIFNSIFDHYQHKSALIVSHRFSTVRRAHRIVVLQKGSIVEQGSHADLMKQQGLYHDLFTKQAEGYK